MYLILLVISLSFLKFSKIMNWGWWSDIEVVKFPETDRCDWLLRKILLISVCDVKVDLVGRVICGVKLFEKRCSRNSAVPLFWLYFTRLKLKFLAEKVSLPSALIFDRSGSRNSLLNYTVSLMGVYRWCPVSSWIYLELNFDKNWF